MACVITALTPTPEPLHNYSVYSSPDETITWTDFVQTPACGYTLDYDVKE